MEGLTIKNRIKSLLRSPSRKLKRSRRVVKENLSNKLTLERVLGITASGSSGLTCDPGSGIVAYPAGCVIVLLNPTKNSQQHIINTSRKTITALAFSSDGKYLVTGEHGHLPAVRVWHVAHGFQVAALQEHKYGVGCVAFSPNSKYIVSTGYQHDMSINVWAWKKNMLVAANKVSSKVTAVSFSEDSSYFVTSGNRHVRYWYLEPWNSNKQLMAPVPLLGRSGLLGELQNNNFCDVACGRGGKSESTFCITSSGLLCEFNEKRMLDKWVDLRTSTASALFVTEELIFCACADGIVRVFNPPDLRFICTLPRPHHLGTDISAVTHDSKPDACYPDLVAVTYDPANLWLSCVYNDHSLYVWDVQDLQKVEKVYSGVYHFGCVWDVETYPAAGEDSRPGLGSSGMFFSCSADSTIRMWSTEPHINPTIGNLLSNDLREVIYKASNSACLMDMEETGTSCPEKPEEQPAESRTGIRTICVSPDGKHLASGDQNGTISINIVPIPLPGLTPSFGVPSNGKRLFKTELKGIHELGTMEEVLKVQVHDSEVLCLEYSKPETGMKLLASAGRDRLIQVLDVEEDYRLLQTLDEHSSSITAVRFAASEGKVRLISCGADKSVYFRTAHRTFRGVRFKRTHHVVRKITLHDMDVDPTGKYAAVACQDRNVRVFNISSGKQKKSFKGSSAEDGSLLRLQMDPSGLYVATSCSDRNLSLFDFRTGECLAVLFGHSENITGIKFTSDYKHLISASADSCIFIWRLAPELTNNMKERPDQFTVCPSSPVSGYSVCRRDSSSSLEMHSTLSLMTCSSESERDDYEDRFEGMKIPEDHNVHQPSSEEDQGASDDPNDWDSIKLQESSTASRVSESSLPEVPHRRKRWNFRMGSFELMAKSMLELRQFDSFPKPSALSGSTGQLGRQAHGSTASLHSDTKRQTSSGSSWLGLASPPKPEVVVLSSGLCPSSSDLPGANQEQEKDQRQDSHSPDRGSSMGYASGGSSPVQAYEGSDDPESLSTEEEDDETARRRLFHKPESFVQERLFTKHFETVAHSNNTGNEAKPLNSLSACFLAQGSTSRRRSRILSKTDQKSKKCAVLKPLVSTVHPLRKDCQGTNSEQRADTHSSEQLRLAPKERKTCMVQNVTSPISTSRVALTLDKPLLKSASTLSLTANSQKCATMSLKKQASRPSTPELPSDRNDLIFRHPSPTDLPSPQPSESPNTIRRPKVRSYMSPTTSSRAKVMSVKEALHLNLSSGQTSPSPGSSPIDPSHVSTSHSPSLSAPLPGPCESRLSHGRCSPNPTVKTTKDARVFARMSYPLSEYPSRPISRSVSVKDTLGPKTTPHTPQHPLLDVRPLSGTRKSRSDQEPSMDLETCRQAAAELYNSVKKATHLYTMMSCCLNTVSLEQQEMQRVLMEALFMAHSELEAVPGLTPVSGTTVLGEGEEKTLALLEQYSRLLLKSVEKRLEHKM